MEIFEICKELFCSERLALADIRHQGCSLKRGAFPLCECSGPLNIPPGLCPAVYEGEGFFCLVLGERGGKGKGILIS